MRIALIAHDQKKGHFVAWAVRHQEQLRNSELYATGTTGGMVQAACPQLTITRMKSGPLGGDQQIGAMIAEDKIDAVFFFIDPLTSMPHDVDVKALIRLSGVYNIPIACNEATADLLVKALFACQNPEDEEA